MTTLQSRYPYLRPINTGIKNFRLGDVVSFGDYIGFIYWRKFDLFYTSYIKDTLINPYCSTCILKHICTNLCDRVLTTIESQLFFQTFLDGSWNVVLVKENNCIHIPLENNKQRLKIVGNIIENEQTFDVFIRFIDKNSINPTTVINNLVK